MATVSTLPSPMSQQVMARLLQNLRQRLAPPPDLLISEWAEQNIVLPKGASARPGPWSTESFQREMMDVIRDPHVREVIIKTCAQIGKSSVLNNVVGYFIDCRPCSIMMVQPTDLTAKNYSKKRIRPLIGHCAALKRKVREVRDAGGRRLGSTTLLKEFDGGFLKIAGANSSAGLRSDPVKVLLLDEVDGYPSDVDGEGDPVVIATRRTDAFPDAIIVKVSTPGKPRGLSTIENGFNGSDQRRFFVPCPFCQHMQPLVWRDDKGLHRLVWDRDQDGKPIPATVRYLCEACNAPIDEKHKSRMLAGGRWIAAHPGRPIVGFHINALYSPWRMVWPDLALEWTNAQGDSEKLKAFINLRLAETFEELGDAVEAHELEKRKEKQETEEATLPKGVCVLVAAADVQDNRIESHILGFGPGEESWLLAYERFYFDPSLNAEADSVMDHAWLELDDFLLRQWNHPSGLKMAPAIALVDSGAHSNSVYNFVMPRQHARRRVYACKGMESLTRPGLAQEGATKRARVRLWLVNTTAAKDQIFSRLKVAKPGPRYMHFPDWTPEEYFRQLTAEKKIVVRNKRTRTTKHVYVKTYDRNEALDMTAYAHAGLFILQQFIAPATYRDLARLAVSHTATPEPEQENSPAAQRKRSNWIKDWRK